MFHNLRFAILAAYLQKIRLLQQTGNIQLAPWYALLIVIHSLPFSVIPRPCPRIAQTQHPINQ